MVAFFLVLVGWMIFKDFFVRELSCVWKKEGSLDVSLEFKGWVYVIRKLLWLGIGSYVKVACFRFEIVNF